jgi:hypothetical protein
VTDGYAIRHPCAFNGGWVGSRTVRLGLDDGSGRWALGLEPDTFVPGLSRPKLIPRWAANRNSWERCSANTPDVTGPGPPDGVLPLSFLAYFLLFLLFYSSTFSNSQSFVFWFNLLYCNVNIFYLS